MRAEDVVTDRDNNEGIGQGQDIQYFQYKVFTNSMAYEIRRIWRHILKDSTISLYEYKPWPTNSRESHKLTN